MNDVFEVLKMNCHRHMNVTPDERLVTHFTVPDYEYYKKGIRMANITQFATRWLNRHWYDDFLYLKIRKYNDDPDVESYRFAYNENHLPLIIIRSEFYMNRERVRRQAMQTSATPLCNSQNNRTKCCLQSTQVPSEQLDGSLLLAEMPTLVTIYRCSGLCRKLLESFFHCSKI